MATFLSELARPAKLVLGLWLACAPGLRASEPRLFWSALWEDGKEAATAPARWGPLGWSSAAALGLGLGVLANNDPAAYHSMRGRTEFWTQASPVFRDMADGLYAPLGAAALWGLGAGFGAEGLADTSASALESLALVGIFSPLLKAGFAANRPGSNDQHHGFFDYSPGLKVFNASFPSGHTMAAFALAESYGSRYGRWWTYPLAACTGYARIYEAAHWPSDVAAGAALGIGLAYVVSRARDAKGAPTLLWSVAPSGGLALSTQTRF